MSHVFPTISHVIFNVELILELFRTYHLHVGELSNENIVPRCRMISNVRYDTFRYDLFLGEIHLIRG
jgi:hypothetical protein